MNFIETPLAGAYIIEMRRLSDERGFFARSFSASEFAAHGLPDAMPECSVSYNAQCGTLRGMHFRAAPHAEDKVVRCTAGAVYDVIIDLRRGSATERRWFGTELSAQNHRALFVPKGFAHGFITLRDDTEILYMMSLAYVAGFDRGVRWNDPAFGIAWPLQPSVIAARDAEYPLLDAGA